MIIIARWCITIYKMQRLTIFKQLVTVEYVGKLLFLLSVELKRLYNTVMFDN